MLESVKLALRISTDAFDDELRALIASAKADLGIVADTVSETDPLTKMAIITYCKVNFGSPEEYDRLKKSYDEQKAQIRSCSAYRGD